MKTLLHLEENPQPKGKEMSLPFDASQEEVQTALNLGAVYEAVDVESVYSFSGQTFCPMTNWKTTDKKGKKQNMNLHGISQQRWAQHRPERHAFDSFIYLLLLRCSQIPYFYLATS